MSSPRSARRNARHERRLARHRARRRGHLRHARVVPRGRRPDVGGPPWAARLLRQIPPAALAAIVLPALVRPEGTIDLAQPRLVAGLFAGLVAWKSRNVVLTLILGIGGLMLLEAIW